MSKEHAYAYEAGYRDGSIHYELEHCPACKNVADLQEALAEIAKLQETLQRRTEQFEGMCEMWVERGVENAKLRELVRELWAQAEQNLVCDENCPYGATCNWMDSDVVCVFKRRMRELGVDE